MKTTPKALHLKFWRSLNRDLRASKPLIPTLTALQGRFKGTAFAAPIRRLVDGLTAGKALSESMSKQPALFTPFMNLMVRAGEMSGMLDIVAERLADGIADGSIPTPGAKLSRRDEAPRFWRAFTAILSTGVPILQALKELAENGLSPAFRTAVLALHDAIQNGEGLTAAMQKFPELFPAEVCNAMFQAERTGHVTDVGVRIADAIEKKDFSTLSAVQPADATAPAQADVTPILKLINAMILEAMRQRATDIHVDPTENGGSKVRFRVDGVLRDADPIPTPLHTPVMGRLKLMGDLRVNEAHVPQDGRFCIEALGRKLDVRVSSIPALFGERVTMRLLDRSSICFKVGDLGLPEDDRMKIQELCHLKSGIVVCTGPTGSGKTTLLYSMLLEVDRKKKCVMSVEDPVEYTLDGIAQIPVKVSVGLTFPKALRSILRQDPDVIMVGEIRDLETARVVVQAAITGHLIVTTLHTNSAAGVVQRFTDIGLEPFLVNSSLAAAVAQRLVRKLCLKCRAPYAPKPEEIPQAGRSIVAASPNVQFYRAVGCDECGRTGYLGRSAIHEILVPNDTVRRLILKGADVASIHGAACESGMKTLLQSGIEKAARGLTTIDEVVRVVLAGTPLVG